MPPRDHASHFKFVQALRDGQEDEAGHLVYLGLIEVDACVGELLPLQAIYVSFDVPIGLLSFAEAPLLFYAIYYQREKVVRKLVEFAAEERNFDLLNEFSTPGFIGAFNAAGIATYFCRPTMVALVYELGSSLSNAHIPFRSEDGKPVPALMVVMRFAIPDCLAFILEHSFPKKKIDTSPMMISGLAALAWLGIPASKNRSKALEICEMLQEKGFGMIH